MGNYLVERIGALRRVRNRDRGNARQMDHTGGSDCGVTIGPREKTEEGAAAKEVRVIQFPVDSEHR
jgi:hypothetical protein